MSSTEKCTEHARSVEPIESIKPDPKPDPKAPEEPVELGNPDESKKNDDLVVEKIEHKPCADLPTVSGTISDAKGTLSDTPFEMEKVGEIVKEEQVLKDAKKKLQDMIREVKGIEISDKNIDEIVDQVDKSCVDEIIATQMRVEWERVFVNHYDELYAKLKDFDDLTVDLENSRIVILEDKSSDYEIKLKDQDIEECLMKYGDRVVGRGLHARVIVELLVLSDIHHSLSSGINLEEALSKFDAKEMGQIAINLGENFNDLGYREGIAYAFLIILESHNIGIKEIEEGKNEEDKKAVEKKYK